MSTAPKYEPRYSISDYEQWDGDWELWNGIPVSMSPSPIPEHQSLAFRLGHLITLQLESMPSCRGCQILLEVDWKVSLDTIVRPDVLITCEPLAPKNVVAPPVFIAEILSPATAHKDRTAKRDLYQWQKVPAYLMVDPADYSIEFLRLGGDGVYQPEELDNQTMLLQLGDECSIRVNLNRLFEG